MFSNLLQRSAEVTKRVWWAPLALCAFANCGSGDKSFGDSHEGGPGSAGSEPGSSGSTSVDASNGGDATSFVSPGEDGGSTSIVLPDVDVPDVTMIYQAFDGALVNAPGGCKPGHYTGTFAGSYSSFLTFVGVPIPVAGDVSLDLDESSNGEFYTISNGTISGSADLLIPYFCDMVGTLNCKTKKLENGALRNCTYCVGAADYTADARVCLGVEGHFNGPLDSDYDSSIHSFVNGNWAGSEETDTDAAIDAGGGCKIGPANYGGCGTWSAQLGP